MYNAESLLFLIFSFNLFFIIFPPPQILALIFLALNLVANASIIKVANSSNNPPPDVLKINVATKEEGRSNTIKVIIPMIMPVPLDANDVTVLGSWTSL